MQLDIKQLTDDDLKYLTSIMPWNILSEFILKNAKLYKQYTLGSFLVTKKNISRFTSILRCFGSDDDFISLFLLWYDHEKNYQSKLDPYLKSPEYSQFIADKELEIDKYMLDQSMFDELCDMLCPRHAKIFRCMSPIVFDSDQHAKLIDIENIVENNSDKIIEPLISQHSIDVKSDELKQTKKELKQIKEKCNDVEKRCAELETDNLKLRNKLIEKRKRIKELEIEKTDFVLAHGSELQKKVDEINEINIKLNELIKLLIKSDHDIKVKDNQIDNINKKLLKLQASDETKISSILINLDIDRLISYLNSPNEIQECLISIVKPPLSDDKLKDIDQSDGFDNLYLELDRKETKLIDKVINININDIINNNLSKSWPEKSDDFYNMRCILSAKLFLVNTLYEIIRQYYVVQTEPTYTSNK